MDNNQSYAQQGSSLNCNGHDSSCDEESFVVLSNPSSQFNSPGSSMALPRGMNLNSTSFPSNMSSSVPVKSPSVDPSHCSMSTGSFATDVSPEEIQKKLTEVLQENLDLKETLHQNNLAMKQQLTTLGTWQAEVAKLHKNHKEKFSETKELILKLRTENEELKKEAGRVAGVADRAGENARLRAEVEELRGRLAQAQAQAPSGREAELSELAEGLSRRLEGAERARRQLGVDVERLEALRARAEREAAPAREEVRLLRDMCAGKEKEIAALKAVVRDLEGEVASRDQRGAKETGGEGGGDAGKTSSIDSEASGVAQAGERGGGADRALEELRNKVKELEKTLEEERALGRDRLKRIAEGQEQFRRLFAEYQAAGGGDASYREAQARGLTERADRLTAQVMKLEDDLALRDRRVDDLEAKVRQLEADNESIPVLQLQMEVYQSDFNAEREARENMAGEKERLAEDLRLLQQRNQRLLAELKLHQQGGAGSDQHQASGNMGWNTISNPQRNHPRENTPPSPGPFDY